MIVLGIVILSEAKNLMSNFTNVATHKGTHRLMHQNTSTSRITRQDVPTMYFIGVTTGQSTMTRLFPHWAAILGLDKARLVGIDLPLQASDEQYRQAVAQIKCDPLSAGALVTTHKINLFNAAQNMFDAFDPYAQLCREVDCITKQDGQLIALSRDPLGSRRALLAIIGPRYWSKSNGHVLCLGAGGAGTAITVNLLTHLPSPTLKTGRSGLSSSTITSTDWTGCAPLWNKSTARLRLSMF
jgi:shikimate 5-dehydrogenase